MVPNPLIYRAASALTAVGVVLVAANWYVKPELWVAWTAPLAMFAVMFAALRWSQRARRRSTGTPPRRPDVATAVVFAALMMGIPLMLTLARSYGLVQDVDFGRRSTGVLVAAFLVLLGNVMPKQLSPLSSMACDGARRQAFQRLTGWTWVLCGLGSGVAWLTLPIDAAETMTTALAVTSMAITIAQILRLRRPRKEHPASGLN